jgi:hypothetical protein
MLAKTWAAFDVRVSGVVAATLDRGSGELRVQRLPGRSEAVVAFAAALPGPVRATYEGGDRVRAGAALGGAGRGGLLGEQDAQDLGGLATLAGGSRDHLRRRAADIGHPQPPQQRLELSRQRRRRGGLDRQAPKPSQDRVECVGSCDRRVSLWGTS